MAAKTFYLLDAKNSSVENMQLQDGGSPPSTARIGTGWIVGTVAATKYALMDSQTERASSALQVGALPDTGPENTLGDSFRSVNTLNGTFADANWSLSFQIQGESRSTSTTDGILRIRIWKSANANGSGATELTGATIITTQFTNLANTAAQTITATWSPGGTKTLTNEYIFIQIAFQLDGAGNNTNADVHLCVGSSNSITTSNFVGINELTAAGITTGASAVAAPTIGQKHVLISTNIATGNPTLGAPTLAETGGEDNLEASGIDAGTPTLGASAIGQVHSLMASGIATGTPTEGNPAIGQVHALTTSGIDTGSPTVGTPAIGQIHALTGTGLDAWTPSLGAPNIGQKHALGGQNGQAGNPTLGTPAMGQAHGLYANGVTTSSAVVGIPAITQSHALAATGVTLSAPILGAPTLAEFSGDADNLIADGIDAGAPVFDTPAVGQVHSLTATFTGSSPVLGSPAIQQFHALVAAVLLAGTPVLGAPGLGEPGEGTIEARLLAGMDRGVEKGMFEA